MYFKKYELGYNLMSVDKKLKITATNDTRRFRAGDIIATPLALTYIAGKGFSYIGWTIGQGLLWSGGRVVEKTNKRFHQWSLEKISSGYNKSVNWVNGHLNNPKVAFAISFPLIIANSAISIGATAIALAAPFTTISSQLVGLTAIGAKLAKASLPIMFTMWNKAEGSKGHKHIQPIFQKIARGATRLDAYVEDIFPIYKRTKNLFKKAPLSPEEEKIIKKAPKVFQKMPRALVIAHHISETTLEILRLHPVDHTYDEPETAIIEKTSIPYITESVKPKPFIKPTKIFTACVSAENNSQATFGKKFVSRPSRTLKL